MAVVSLSKIQIRRGRKNSETGVPQLASGELAWAIDTQELYIGNGAVSEGAPAVGNTKILTEHDVLNTISGQLTYSYIDTYTLLEVNTPYLVNSSGGAFSVALPISPEQGEYVVLADGASWTTNNVTVERNGSTIEGLSQDLLIDIGNAILTFIYDGTTWQVISTSGPKGFSGYSGRPGVSGYSGSVGKSGFSGYSGLNGAAAASGYSGSVGASGISGYSGAAFVGSSGYSGASGQDGVSGYSGAVGISGYSGQVGVSGYSGDVGPSGFSGYSGAAGAASASGYSGESGYSGAVGFSGYSGVAGSSSAGKQTVWIPAAAMVSRTTNGAASGTVETTTNKNMIKTLDFDATTQEFAQFEIRMPKSWDEGTVSFVPVWSHAATVTDFGVTWGLDAVAMSNNAALDVAFGTEQTVTDTGGTTDNVYIGPESSAITIAGSPQAEDYVMFRIHRNPSDVGDTMTVDARLHGVTLYYTTDAANDN